MLYDKRWDRPAETVSPVAQALIEARKLIKRREDWFCDVREARGHQRCAGFAIYDAIKDSELQGRAFLALEAITGSIVQFNDTHTHAEVLAAFDRAIAAQQ